jgi:hypothetical protein
MSADTAKTLIGLVSDFYREHHASFSDTRRRPWPGFERCCDAITGVLASPGMPHIGQAQSLVMLDLACGNLRFYDYLAAALPKVSIECHAIDLGQVLVPMRPGISYQSLDILSALADPRCGSLASLLDSPTVDLAVCLGFRHHVPLQDWRRQVLADLLTQTRPGGLAIASFWQYMKSDSLREQARASHAEALSELGAQGRRLEGLGPGDHLLGWQGIAGAWRYCHSFSDSEVDELADSLAGQARLLDRFNSDGRGGGLNAYLVFEKRTM